MRPIIINFIIIILKKYTINYCHVLLLFKLSLYL